MKSVIMSASILTLLGLVVLGYVAIDSSSGDALGAKPPLIPILSSRMFFAFSGLLLGALLVSLVATGIYLARSKVFENIRLKGPNWGIVFLILRLLLIFLAIFFLAALALSFLTFDEEEEDGRRLQGNGDGAIEEVLPEEEPVFEEELLGSGETGPRRSFLVALIVAAVASIIFFGYRYYRSIVQSAPREIDDLQEEMRKI